MSMYKGELVDEIEQRNLFAADSNLSEDEAFEILCESGIDEIKWSNALNESYGQWQYLNLK